MTHYLLDNSVLQRLDRSAEVRTATAELMRSGDLLASSDVSVLEAGFSATSAETHSAVVAALSSDMLRLTLSDRVGPLALDLQAAMFAVDQGRAVGVRDLLQAAIAITHDAVIVHYDSDFELLAAVDGRLRHQWIVPRGSVD